MILVTWEHLLALHDGKAKFNEGIGSFKYSDLTSIADTFARRHEPDFEKQQYRHCLRFMRKCKGELKFVGEGSSRVCFCMQGGKCVKVAKNHKGIEQNKQEVKNCVLGEKYACFPDFFEYDSKNWCSLVCECCSPATRSLIHETYGRDITVTTIVAALNDYIDCGCSLKAAYDELHAMKSGRQSDRISSEYDFIDEWSRMNILKSMLEDPSVRYDSLRALAQFYKDHGEDDQEMRLVDLEAEDNWGIAIRHGVPTAVVIDAGFSFDVECLYKN